MNDGHRTKEVSWSWASCRPVVARFVNNPVQYGYFFVYNEFMICNLNLELQWSLVWIDDQWHNSRKCRSYRLYSLSDFLGGGQHTSSRLFGAVQERLPSLCPSWESQWSFHWEHFLIEFYKCIEHCSPCHHFEQLVWKSWYYRRNIGNGCFLANFQAGFVSLWSLISLGTYWLWWPFWIPTWCCCGISFMLMTNDWGSQLRWGKFCSAGRLQT